MENIGGIGVQIFAETSVQVLDNPLGFELYAEGPVGMFSAGGNVSITLYAPRADPAGKIYRVVVGRITMPGHGAHNLAVGLFDFLTKAGLNPDSQRPESVQ